MAATPLFGSNISPACDYCAHSQPSTDHTTLHCPYTTGTVQAYHHCKQFVYAPLRRKPRRAPKLPSFSPEDFML